MDNQNQSKWEALSDRDRPIPKCKACMAVRRASKERGFGPHYCVDCEETLKSATVTLVRDLKGKPVYLETDYRIEQKRPCRECGKLTTFYRFCNDCKHLESELDDMICMGVEGE